MQAWVSARKASDFSKFKDYLQQWVDVSLQKAAAIDPSRPAYDVSTFWFQLDPIYGHTGLRDVYMHSVVLGVFDGI